MFSPTEREFLLLMAHEPASTRERTLRARFPNPVYRRKLLWGIRRKASAAASDWALYTRAAEREARLLRPGASESPGSVPTVTEPFAALVKLLGGSGRRPRPVRSGGGR